MGQPAFGVIGVLDPTPELVAYLRNEAVAADTDRDRAAGGSDMCGTARAVALDVEAIAFAIELLRQQVDGPQRAGDTKGREAPDASILEYDLQGAGL